MAVRLFEIFVFFFGPRKKMSQSVNVTEELKTRYLIYERGTEGGVTSVEGLLVSVFDR